MCKHVCTPVPQVLGMLRVLAECGQLKDEHLDLLWGVTEQEGTFDAVKTNVCHMIKQLAPHMAPQQLDRLFSKFETSGAGGRSSDGGTPSGGTGAASGGSTSSGGGGGGRSGRSVPDTLRLLDLLRRLANSDKVGGWYKGGRGDERQEGGAVPLTLLSQSWRKRAWLEWGLTAADGFAGPYLPDHA